MLTELTASSTMYPGAIRLTVYASGLDYAPGYNLHDEKVEIDSVSCRFIEIGISAAVAGTQSRTIFRVHPESQKDPNAALSADDETQRPPRHTQAPH